MTRKELILHLLENPKTVRQLALECRQSPAAVEEDLKHIVKSLRHQEIRLLMIPARCKKCQFEFGEDRFRKPSKCPACRGTWISEPQVSTTRID